MLGSAYVNWPLRIAALLLIAWRRHWLRLAAFALAVVTSELFIGPVKGAVDRPRPPGALIETTAASFPPATRSPARSPPSGWCSCWRHPVPPGGAGRCARRCSVP